MISITILLIILEFIILITVCYFLLKYYKSSMVSFDVTLSVYVSWVLGFTGILLLPLDISTSLLSNTKSIILDRCWRFIYWSTFLLAWFVLPIQQEYHASGQFSIAGKIRDACYKNILSGVIAILFGVVIIIYLVVTDHGSLSDVISFFMAMSNTYGILLIIGRYNVITLVYWFDILSIQ